MGRLTKRGIKQEGMIWFIDHENNDIPLEPCEMNPHHNRVALEKLADYEDKQEQGLLIELPCKVGDTIYVIHSKVNYDLNVLNGFGHLNKVHKQKVHSIELYGDNRYLVVTCEGMCSVVSDSYKETWFLTEAKAEEALAKMGEET